MSSAVGGWHTADAKCTQRLPLGSAWSPPCRRIGRGHLLPCIKSPCLLFCFSRREAGCYGLHEVLLGR